MLVGLSSLGLLWSCGQPDAADEPGDAATECDDEACAPPNGRCEDEHDQWLQQARAIVEGYCEYLSRCGDATGGGACVTEGYTAVETTCCEEALELFSQSAQALADCTDLGGLDCGLGFEEVCPALADAPFEQLCRSP